MIEVEKKAVLSNEDFENFHCRLRDRGVRHHCYRQVNHYYDTNNFDLYKTRITLRLREKAGVVRLEVKQKQGIKDGAVISNEKSQVIDKIPESLELTKIIPDTDFSHKSAKYLGNLTTQRTDWFFRGYIVSTDINSYLGHLDYEIEIEYSIETVCVDWDYLGIAFSEKPEGKYTRFLRLYQPQLFEDNVYLT